ncbi:ABC transporter substrate-binding protein [Thioalkalivibrio sp. HK1]|uniref:ABC transporter substrate-binding protein n=1 Tax=Thioalkalivibrio sp. HK1 TaxID=1469245 RepID=UPI0018CC3B26|nr:ABC transporter substrate-binding protein [Thioalkalivibrio sp. HK1]
MHDRNRFANLFGRRQIRSTTMMMAGVILALGSAGAVAQPPIKIGVLLPDTGVNAAIGKEQKAALRMAFDEFGRKVAGRKIELIEADTETKPAAGLASIKRLILRDEVDIVTGIVSSGVAGAVRNYVHESKTPLILTLAGNNRITGEDCSPWIMRMSFSNAQLNRDMGPWLAKQGYKKAFLMAFDYVAGHQMMDAFAEGFTAGGGDIIGESYPPFAQVRDFGPYLAEIKASEPDLVYAFFSGGPAIKFISEWNAFGLQDKIQLAGPALNASALYVGEEGGDTASGAYSPLWYHPAIDTRANRIFRESFLGRYGREATEFGAIAYDTARVIVDALKKLEGRTDNPEALMRAMVEMEFSGTRGPFKIDPKTHNVIGNIYVGRNEMREGMSESVIKHTFTDVRDSPMGCGLAG